MAKIVKAGCEWLEHEKCCDRWRVVFSLMWFIFVNVKDRRKGGCKSLFWYVNRRNEPLVNWMRQSFPWDFRSEFSVFWRLMEKGGDGENKVGFGLHWTMEAECWGWNLGLRVRSCITNGRLQMWGGISPKVTQAESSRSDYCFHPFPDHALYLESLSPK